MSDAGATEKIEQLCSDVRMASIFETTFSLTHKLTRDKPMPEEIARRLLLLCSNDLPDALATLKAMQDVFEDFIKITAVRTAIRHKQGE